MLTALTVLAQMTELTLTPHAPVAIEFARITAMPAAVAVTVELGHERSQQGGVHILVLEIRVSIM